MDDLISVIIPFYSNKKWLDEALESVVKQTYKTIEILIVDDGSKEDITEIVNKYKKSFDVNYLRKKNGGPASARNLGITKAKGLYIAFLDSDDVWYEEKLEEQLKYMKESNVYWSQHCYEYFDDSGILSVIDTSKYKGNIFPFLYTSFKVQTSCFMIKSIVFNDSNIRFDEKKRFGEDAALYKKIGELYPLGCCNKILAKFRIRNNNAGFDPYVQIRSRGNTWASEKEDIVFIKNTNKSVKFGHWYCYFVLKIIDKLKLNNRLIGNILYLLPWIIFKINYKKLIKRRK